MSTNYSSEAVQIIKTEDDGSMKLEEDALREILDDEEHASKKVVVVSVAGAFRGGKSFLLGFFLRYLENEGRVGWIGDKNTELQGFSWTIGSSRHTTGVWAWKKLFTLPNLPEVAIMLLDTQGLFDNQSTMKVSAKVFGLSAMVSSVQIYNLSQKISEVDLQHLQFFTAYGRHAERESMDSLPFQSLLFLVRDWQSLSDYKFGWEDGDKYLKKVLKTESSTENSEVREVRQHIRECFKDIHCFLMPRPGDVVENVTFKGETKDMRPVFIEQLQNLIQELFRTSKMVIKENNGEEVTCSQMYEMFERYVTAFAGEDIPEPTTIFRATAELYNQKALEKARQHFRNEMNKKFGPDQPYVEENELKEAYGDITVASLSKFRSSPRLGGHGTTTAFEEQLEGEFEQRYKEYVKNNEHKKGLLVILKKSMRQIKYTIRYLAPVITGIALLGGSEVTFPMLAVTLFLAPLFFGDSTGLFRTWFQGRYLERANSSSDADDSSTSSNNTGTQMQFPMIALITSIAKVSFVFVLIWLLWTSLSTTFSILLTLLIVFIIAYLLPYLQRLYGLLV